MVCADTSSRRQCAGADLSVRMSVRMPMYVVAHISVKAERDNEDRRLAWIESRQHELAEVAVQWEEERLWACAQACV